MKKFIVTLLMTALFLGNTLAFAIDWHTADQITIMWNANAQVVAPDVLTYGVYKRMLPSGQPVFVEETDTLTSTITFDVEGRYTVGVTSIRYVGGAEGERLESSVNWSDENGASTPNPFGASYFVIPNPPLNLRK